VARVFLRPEWRIHINGRKFDEYFVTEHSDMRRVVRCRPPRRRHLQRGGQRLRWRRQTAKPTQSRWEIARALLEFNAELRKALKAEGFPLPRRSPAGTARSTDKRAAQALPILRSAKSASVRVSSFAKLVQGIWVFGFF